MSLRPAWVEVDMARLQRNFEIINSDKPQELNLLVVVKDQAYGHGAVQVANLALQNGAKYLAVATVNEAVELRQHDISAPILVFGERTEDELKECVDYNLTCCINDLAKANKLAGFANDKRIPIHVEVDTGLSRYGVGYDSAVRLIQALFKIEALQIEGVMSHFAMSDEEDKTFALLQLERFQKILADLTRLGIQMKYRHICNTGGFLDLPQAHLDMVRIGILPLGVYPSRVCRRIAGLQPVMSVKTRVAAIRDINVGDTVGYGMRYKASSPRKIAVLPVGYGDGYPRVRNQGEVLIRGRRAPVVGGNAMDAMMVDVSDIPDIKLWDEVTLMGSQGNDEINVHDIAALKGTVSYAVLSGWRARLPRIYINKDSA